MDYLASMYIDNEMDLEEKRQFVEMVRCDDEFYTLTVELLDQEQRLRQMPAMLPVPAVEQRWRPPLRHLLASLARPFGFAVHRLCRRRPDAEHRLLESPAICPE